MKPSCGQTLKKVRCSVTSVFMVIQKPCWSNTLPCLKVPLKPLKDWNNSVCWKMVSVYGVFLLIIRDGPACQAWTAQKMSSGRKNSLPVTANSYHRILMTTLIIARHGNTFSLGETVTRVGITDLPLVESGLKQGLQLGTYLRANHLLPDIIFTSKLT